jgi:membrane protein YqaA with SNARE-associated domain
MGRLAAWIRGFALTLGAPGLFLVALGDSSFLSLPEVVDLLVVLMVARHHDRLVLYVCAATFGSLAGCLILYAIGRQGGHVIVAKRLTSAGVDRTLAALRRHGMLAVLVPALLPPPAPFKPFVLLAGAAEITPARFSLAVLAGRGARYLILGVLAVEYGDRALAYAEAHGLEITLILFGLLGAGGAAFLLWRKAQDAQHR